MKNIFPLIFACLVSLVLLDNPVAEEVDPSANECFSSIGKENGFITNIEECDIPTQAETTQGGWEEAPIASCPRPSKYYSDLLDRLNGIRLQVRDEACKDPKVTIERDLKTLISSDRKTFVQYIKEGAVGEGEQLDPDKVAFVKEYVTNVLNTADSIAEDLDIEFLGKTLGIGRNKACFSDEEKESTLSFVGSVVSEVSGALGAVAGPFGSKIALGGEIAGQLMVSVDKLIQDNKEYDFNNEDDFKNYLNSFCTYYDFKSELDRELNWFDNEYNQGIGDQKNEGLRLAETKNDLEAFLTLAYEKCPACEQLINTIDKLENGEIDLDEGTQGSGVPSFDDDGSSGPDLPSGGDPEGSVSFDIDPVNRGETDAFEGTPADGSMGVESRDIDSDERFKSILQSGALAELTPEALIRAGILDFVQSEDLENLEFSQMSKAERELRNQSQRELGLGAGIPNVAHDPQPIEGWLEKREALQNAEKKANLQELQAIMKHFKGAASYVKPEFIVPEPRSIQVAIIQAMQTLKWVEAELEVQSQNRSERAGEFLTEPVKESMQELEGVLAGAIPDFVNHIRNRLNKQIRALKQEASDTLDTLNFQENGVSFAHRNEKFNYAHDPEKSSAEQAEKESVFADPIPEHENFNLEAIKNTSTHMIVTAFNELLRRDYNFTEVLERFNYSQEVQADLTGRRKAHFIKLKELLTPVINDHILGMKSCEFFTNSLYRESAAVKSACKRAYQAMAQSQEVIYHLLFNSYLGDLNPDELKLAFKKRPNYVPDWVASVRFGIKRDTKNLQKALRSFEN